MTKREIIESARQLSHDEQVDLAMEFWKIVESRDDDFALTDDQKAELDRRIAEADRNPQAAEDWASVKEKLLRGEL